MGYGKIESLGALGVSGLLLTGGIMIGLQSVLALSQQFFPEVAHILSHVGLFEHGHSHSHSHSGTDLGPKYQCGVVGRWQYYREGVAIPGDDESGEAEAE